MAPVRVLLVDDDAGVRAVTRASLMRVGGIETDEASDIRHARELLELGRYRAVLVDVRLGAQSGLDLIDWMQASPRHSLTPVILFSADATEIARTRGLAGSVRGVIQKPFDAGLLGRSVLSLLGCTPDSASMNGVPATDPEDSWLGDLWVRHRESIIADLAFISDLLGGGEGAGTRGGPASREIDQRHDIDVSAAIEAAHRLHGAFGVYERDKEAALVGSLHSMLRAGPSSDELSRCRELVTILQQSVLGEVV